MVPVPRVIPVGPVVMAVVCKVTTAAGVVDSTVCGTTVEDEDEEVEVLEVEGVLEDVVDEEVVEEDEVMGVVEVEDCWADVVGVVEVEVEVEDVVVAGAEVGLGVADFCVSEVALLAVLVKIGRSLGLNLAARCMR